MGLQKEDNSLKSATEIKQLFSDAGVDPNGDKTLILSCGGGIFTTVMHSALREIGATAEIKMFDGSWTEFKD